MSEHREDIHRSVGEPWTVEMMRTALDRKGVDYRTSRAFTSLLGITITNGKTAIISIREGLQDAETVRVLAHELGHLALGHCSTRSNKGTIADLMRGQYDEAAERQVDIWAAHLLVDPQVYGQHIGSVDVVNQVAQTLALPESVVQTWLESRGEEFEVNPREWFYSDGHWFDLSPPPLESNSQTGQDN